MEKYNVLFEIAKAAAEKVDRREFKKEKEYDDKDIKKIVKEAIDNNEIILKLKKTIFPGEVTISEDFFEKIEIFYSLCGFNDDDRILCAKISKLVFEEIGIEKTIQLLDILTSSTDRFSWTFLHILTHLLKIYELDPKYASKLFWIIIDRTKNDLAGGDIYIGIENYASSFPNLASELFNILKKGKLDDINVSIASMILGVIRNSVDSVSEIKIKEFEDKLKNSDIIEDRKIYYYSYTSTYKITGVNIEELEKLLINIIKDIPEINEIQYKILERCIIFSNKDKNLIIFIIDWLKNHCDNISDISQYNIMSAFYWIGKNFKELNDNNIVNDLNSIFSLIQPFKSKNTGTWRNVEYYLEDLLEYNKESFNNAIYVLIEKSYDDFLYIIRNDNQFFLIHTLKNKKYNEFLFPLLISENSKLRNFAFELSQEIGLTLPNESILKDISKKELYILLYGTSLKYIASPKIGDFLINIEPLYRNSEEDLKNEFIQEMIYQALNFPGACLDKWSKQTDKSDILSRVVNVAEAYFKNLRETDDIPANSYIYPEILEGEKKWRKDFASGVSRNTKKYSVFLSLIRTSNILYGNKWSIYDYTQKMQEPTGFGETSTTFEWPRLEIIDPEGMAVRRINIRFKLNSLIK